jgi:hypothetical protein
MGKIMSDFSNPRWIGQVAVNQTENQTSKDGVGIRVRVRILYSSLPDAEGTHSQDSKIRDRDLPLAMIQMPPTVGYGNRVDTGIVGGETVTGYFLNGDIRVPVIDGVLVRTVSENQLTAQEAERLGSSFGKRINPYSQNKNFSSSTNRLGGEPSSGITRPSKRESGLRSFFT